MLLNPLHLIDGYKLSHREQYPENTSVVLSNWTPRGSRISHVNKITFFGLQYFLKEYLEDLFNEQFFEKRVSYSIDKYKRRTKQYLGSEVLDVKHIEELHSIGYLPLEIRALSEGTSVPLRVPMMTITNTHPCAFWLPNYLETLFSNVSWMPSTSATVARRMRKLLNQKAIVSGEDISLVDFQGHDFSMRGMSGVEAALLSGAGHLIFFKGTDTFPVLDFLDDYYCTEESTDIIGMSIPATEHSVTCAGGYENEEETYRRIINLYPSGFVSLVFDSWDYFNALTNILPRLKDQIMSRPGRVVIRPDSGVPEDIVCGNLAKAPHTPEGKGSIQLLWDIFGGTINSKGLKVLDPHIGLIYGDSINYERAELISRRLIANGFASTNVIYGMGSYGYQLQTRDTFGFAMKATYCEVDGKPREIFKKPKTDKGDKNSAKGKVAVLKDVHGNLYLKDQATQEELNISQLKRVWRNGKLISPITFSTIRDIAQKDLQDEIDKETS